MSLTRKSDREKLAFHIGGIMDRRKALKLSLKGMGVFVAGAIGVPAMIDALSPVLNKRSEKARQWQPVGEAEAFALGAMKKAVVKFPSDGAKGGLEEFAVYVWRQEADEFVVFSRSCTDLGCPINWDPGSEWFYCPCHGGIFDKTGERKAGPPKRPLWRYTTRIREGILEIDLRSVPPMA